MTVIFKAKTTESHVIKILAELLQNNIKIGCFVIDSSGLTFRMMNIDKCILFDLKLDAKNFNIYKFKKSEKMFIGLNLHHFYKMIRSIKKKDSIQLSIDNKTPNDLSIKVIPKENNRVTTSIIKIQTTQNLNIEIPKNYTNSILIPSSDYQKMCKSMSNIGETVTVSSKNSYVSFRCDTGELMVRHVEFGNIHDSDDDSDDDVKLLQQKFDINRLLTTSKLSGLSSYIHLHSKKNLPLLYKLNVGTLGSLSIFIKEKENYD